MATEKQSTVSEGDLLRLVVEEVDEAREVRELAQQLIHALPLRSFDDVVGAAGTKGIIKFRGHEFHVGKFRPLVPSLLFPIDTPQKLIALLYETVRLAPGTIRYNSTDPQTAKRQIRRLGLIGLPGTALGSRRGRA